MRLPEKMKLPEGEKLAGNKPLLLAMLEHLGKEGKYDPGGARTTGETLLLEYIGDGDIIASFNENVNTDWCKHYVTRSDPEETNPHVSRPVYELPYEGVGE